MGLYITVYGTSTDAWAGNDDAFEQFNAALRAAARTLPANPDQLEALLEPDEWIEDWEAAEIADRLSQLLDRLDSSQRPNVERAIAGCHAAVEDARPLRVTS